VIDISGMLDEFLGIFGHASLHCREYTPTMKLGNSMGKP
jgi:hypothetical protein